MNLELIEAQKKIEKLEKENKELKTENEYLKKEIIDLVLKVKKKDEKINAVIDLALKVIKDSNEYLKK